jgi:cation-transporting ATPase 13A2
MTVGTEFSLWRMRKLGIFCISPPRVNVTGRVNMMVLDKTGTLTEDGLHVYGFRSCVEEKDKNRQSFETFHEKADYLHLTPHEWINKDEYKKVNTSSKVKFLETLASCHQITYVGKELIGDPLDVKMFESINFSLEEQSHEAKEGEEIPFSYMKPIISQDKYNKDQNQIPVNAD